MDSRGAGDEGYIERGCAPTPSFCRDDADEQAWMGDLDSYIPDDDPFLAEGLLGNPLRDASYELVYRIVPGRGDDVLEVAGYRGEPVTVDVPGEWGGMFVARIGDHAFCGCPTICSLTVAEGVGYIGNGAFEECDALRSVKLATWALSIGDRAFANCPVLERVDTDGYISELGDYAFVGCGLLTGADWLDEVDEVGEGVFWGCSSLTGVHLAEWVGPFSGMCLSPCYYDRVFADCTSLRSDSLPSVIWYDLGARAFEGCTSIEEVEIEAHDYSSIGYRAFADCTSLRTAVLTGDVPVICREAFAGCTALEHVVLPDTVERIEPGAFKGCTSLVLVEVEESNAYWDDEPARRIPLSQSGVVVHEDAFEGCSKLNS